jgi:hypothetical protein
MINPLVRQRAAVERYGGSFSSSTDTALSACSGTHCRESHTFGMQRCARDEGAVSRETHVHLSIGLDCGETVLRAIDKDQVETQGAVVRTARRLAQSFRR